MGNNEGERRCWRCPGEKGSKELRPLHTLYQGTMVFHTWTHFNPYNTTRHKYHSCNTSFHSKWLGSPARIAPGLLMSTRNILEVQRKVQMFLSCSPWLPLVPGNFALSRGSQSPSSLVSSCLIFISTSSSALSLSPDFLSMHYFHLC